MFDSGTHVQVRRHVKIGDVVTGVPYWHHGIVVGDGEVVEFGGGDLLHKSETKVRRASLESFRDGDVEEVHHPITHHGITYSDPLPPDEVVDRALWLCVNQPPAYRLGYRNCESIAIWCATGDFESFQVKRFMLGKTGIVSPPIFYCLPRRRALGSALAAGSVIITLLTAVPYMHGRALFDHTRAYPGLGNGDRDRDAQA